MTVLQHYYTSFVNKETGSAGFQVKAMSPGINPEIQAIISRLIAYRIPPVMQGSPVESHPVALRYYYHNAQESILLCSQSNGRDESGRPGNFFAHSVVLPPDNFTLEPPFLYWGSPFWKKQAGDGSVINPLPEFQAEQSLDILDKMWAFLAQKGRREALQKLMSAVVHSERTRRRIIIVDSDEHVALWVAAVSCMLPPTYRPLLSFSTYHHDPYQSWFLITGTTGDSGLRLSPEESVSHFVLNGETNQTSDVDTSPYADLVHSCSNPSGYSTRLLRYFAAYEKRFPLPARIDEQLDQFALYVWLHEQKKPTSLHSSIIEAVNTVLTSFEQLPTYNEEDVQELEFLRDTLARARQEGHKLKAQKAYERLVYLYREHKVPIDKLLREDLRYYAERLLKDIEPVAQKEASEDIQKSCQTYGERAFSQQINERSYVQYLAVLAKDEPVRHLLIWTHFGPYLRPTPYLRSLFLLSTRIWGELRQSKRRDEASALFSALHTAIKGREQDWFPLLEDAQEEVSPSVIADFYWKTVSSFAPEDRGPYRAIIQKVVPGIVDTEFNNDLRDTHVSSKVSVLDRWVAYAQQSGLKDPASLVQQAVDSLRQQYGNEQWRTLALDLLMAEHVAPLLAEREATLASDAFSGLSFQHFSQHHLKLYRRYADFPALPERTRLILAGMVAMAQGQLDPELIARLHSYISTQPPEDYYTQVSSYLGHFLKANPSEESHRLMINAFFTWQYADRFWFAYWQVLWSMLTKLTTQELELVMRLFAFWFNLLPTQLDQYYVVHHFFLTLRQNITYAQTLPGFQEAITNIQVKADIYPWYPALQELFFSQKGGLLSTGQEWVRQQMQKRLRGQKGEEETTERQFKEALAALFTKDALREQHQAKLRYLYAQQSRESFWVAYREQIVLLLLAGDVDSLMECFSFWFENSFDVLGGEPYIAQSFFIGLPQILELARKTHSGAFRKTAQQIEARNKAAPEGPRYGWYPLVQPYFTDQQGSERRAWWPKLSKP